MAERPGEREKGEVLWKQRNMFKRNRQNTFPYLNLLSHENWVVTMPPVHSHLLAFFLWLRYFCFCRSLWQLPLVPCRLWKHRYPTEPCLTSHCLGHSGRWSSLWWRVLWLPLILTLAWWIFLNHPLEHACLEPQLHKWWLWKMAALESSLRCGHLRERELCPRHTEVSGCDPVTPCISVLGQP